MNSLALTKHATLRMAQRGIRSYDVELAMIFGTQVNDGYIVRRKDYQAANRFLTGLLNQLRRLEGTLIVEADGEMITAYPTTRRKQKRIFRRSAERDLP